jgi:hypothetical protein
MVEAGVKSTPKSEVVPIRAWTDDEALAWLQSNAPVSESNRQTAPTKGSEESPCRIQFVSEYQRYSGMASYSSHLSTCYL